MKIVLSAYCYINGERHIEDMCEAFFGKEYKCKITVVGDKYWFSVTEIDFDGTEKKPVYCQMSTGHKYTWGFPLGLYFGGQSRSPHKMTIKMK